MFLENLLALIGRLNHAGIDYAVTGALAATLHGLPRLMEQLEIAIDPATDSARLHAAVAGALPDTEHVSAPAPWVRLRVLPGGTPLFCDFVEAHIPVVEWLTISGVDIRIVPLATAERGLMPQDSWMRPGFSPRERLNAVQSLASALWPKVQSPRGVRKFRSFEAMKVERARFERRRVDQIRAERLHT